MTVICINSASYDVMLNASLTSPVTVGNNYTVTGEEKHWGKTYYKLLGFKQHIGFNSDCFLLCSELDETQLINHPIKKRK